MTNKQLEKLDIHRDGDKRNPNRYWCNTTQSSMNIFNTDTVKSVLERIFNEGIEQGIRLGKEQRSEQIKSILNNDDLS